MDDRGRQIPHPLYTDHRHGMKIKLKISKTNLDDRKLKIEEKEEKEKEKENYRNGEEIESIELTRVVEEKQLRACDFCGKKFGNGKALGGHRRIHLHGGDGQIQKAAAAKKARNDQYHQDCSDNNRSPPDPNRTCCICGKSFPSEKSLFGHMRFHPERTWRGVKPPAVAAAPAPASNRLVSSSSSTISDEEVPDLEETETDRTNPRESVDLISSLTGWAQKNRRGKRSTYVDPSYPSDHHDEDRTEGKGRGGYGYGDDVAAHSLLYLSRGTDYNRARIGYGLDHGSYGEDEEREELRRFRCGTCGRAFSTFQALGGHRSSHSKINGGESTSSDHHRQNNNCNGDDHVHGHKCKICDRSFPSGQALGGHQRSHWAGPTERSETTSSGLGNGKRKLEIDLNEPPHESETEEEEEEAGGGAQYGWYEY